MLVCAAILLAVLSPGCRDKGPEETGTDKSEPNAVAGSVTPASVADGVIAVVNGVEITEGQIEELIRPQLDALADKTKYLPAQAIEQYTEQFRLQALEQLIRAELLDGKIRQANINITDEEVMSQMTQIASSQGISLEDFVKTLEQHGQSLEKMKEDLRERLARSKFMETLWAGKVDVTEAEARKYHDENPEQFKVPEQIRVRHILIMPEEGTTDPNEAMAKAKKTAEDLLAKIKDGADFAETAKENSDCPSASNGGDLDFFARGTATPEFEETAFALEVGQVSGVVATEYGFHIIKTTDHKDPSDLTFEQARETIIKNLTLEERNAFAEEYLKKLKAEAKIVYPTSMQ